MRAQVYRDNNSNHTRAYLVHHRWFQHLLNTLASRTVYCRNHEQLAKAHKLQANHMCRQSTFTCESCPHSVNHTFSKSTHFQIHVPVSPPTFSVIHFRWEERPRGRGDGATTGGWSQLANHRSMHSRAHQREQDTYSETSTTNFRQNSQLH